MNVPLRKGDDTRMEAYCRQHGLEAWYAVYVEEADTWGELYLTSVRHYEDVYGTSAETVEWLMSDKRRTQYLNDPEVKKFRMKSECLNWF